MLPEIQTYLFDILKAITEIESFLEGSSKEFIFFQNDIRPSEPLKGTLKLSGKLLLVFSRKILI